MLSDSRSLLFLLVLAFGVIGPLFFVVHRERSLLESSSLTEEERCRRATVWSFREDEFCRKGLTNEAGEDLRWEGLSASRSWFWGKEKVAEYERLADEKLSTIKVKEENRRSWLMYRGSPMVALSFVGWVIGFLVYLCGDPRGDGRWRGTSLTIGSFLMAVWLFSLWRGVW